MRKGMFGRTKLTKEEKQKRKNYFKMIKMHQKRLDACNKDAHRSPWDYGFGLEYFLEYLRFMEDYYNMGWNVWNADEESTKEIIRTINEVLNCYDEWDNLEEKYMHLNEISELREKYREEKGNFDGKIDYEAESKYIKEHTKYPDRYSEENMKNFREEYDSLRTKFFMLIADNIEKWWD